MLKSQRHRSGFQSIQLYRYITILRSPSEFLSDISFNLTCISTVEVITMRKITVLLCSISKNGEIHQVWPTVSTVPISVSYIDYLSTRLIHELHLNAQSAIL
jgi:hypothetical protein